MAEDNSIFPHNTSDLQVQMLWPEFGVAHVPRVILPSEYSLRTYQTGDEARFLEIMHLAGWADFDEVKLKTWLYRILPEGWFMAIDGESGLIVATAMATHDPTWEVPYCGEVGWVATHPDHTGKGLGTAVVAAVTTRFIEAGYRCIHLYTEQFRLPAIKIYLKLGFVPYLNSLEMCTIWRGLCDQLDWPFTPDAWVKR